MRFRLIEPKDFAVCRSLINPALRLTRRTFENLPTLWRALAAAGTFSIVEDPMKPYPDSVQGFGGSAFVTDRFIDAFMDARCNFLDAALYDSMLDGASPALSEAQIADANSVAGLNLLVLSYGLRCHDLADPTTQRVVQVGSAAFYTLHAGYRLKMIVNEVFGKSAAQYLTAGGFRLQETTRESAEQDDGDVPYLFALRREWVRPGVIDTLSQLFHAPPAQIGFSRAEQRVLVRALLNHSDAEIAEHLGVSLDGVKKAWRRIYDRVSRRLPYLIADDRKSGSTGRSTEKRRHVLDYLRAHPAAVRPARRLRA
jgi:DNA-binding CsgD family transcriptional regulator